MPLLCILSDYSFWVSPTAPGTSGDGPPYQIPFYFHFSFTSSISLIHHYTPPHQCNRTWLYSHSHNIHTCFMGLISLIWWTHDLWFTCFTSILSIPNMCPPRVWPIMSPCTAWSGTYYSFTSDDPYARFLVYHSYLTCLYFTFHSDHHQRRTNQLPIWVSPRIQIIALTPRITSHSPHTILHCLIIPLSLPYTTPGDDPLPPDRTLRAPYDLYLDLQLHRSLLHPRHISSYPCQMELRSILQAWEHSSSVCSLHHAFVLQWAAFHFIWFEFNIYILHRTCPLPDEFPLICGIWGSGAPTSEGPFPYCLWLIWSTSIYHGFHDLWWQILQ